ncbi:MAG TPA: hypothetical protein PLZ51_29240, partial [Aggregatilineales bacterium]|nr:hypothetical protein [Aggregatilineales bacterium]
ALMDAASTRLEGTRNADVCARLYDNYLVASQTFTDFMLAGGRNDDPAEFERLQFELYSTYNSYFNTCI